MRTSLCVLLVFAVVMAFFGSARVFGESSALVPGEERIVFVARQKAGGDYEIFSVRPEGTGIVQLTDNEDEDIDPHWSGGKIVFARGRKTDKGYIWSVWVMDADGRNERQLVAAPASAKYANHARIAPQGDRVLYIVCRRDDDTMGWTYTWHVVNLADGKDTKLKLPSDAQPDAGWSVDGRRIFYTAGTFRDGEKYVGDYRLCEYDLETGDSRTLLPAAKGSWRYSPRVSPDGRSVVFQQAAAGKQAHIREIRVLDLASGKVSDPIATASGGYWSWDDEDTTLQSFQPAWSTDSRWIYFSRMVDNSDPWSGNLSLWRVAANGSAPPTPFKGLANYENASIATVARVGKLQSEQPMSVALAAVPQLEAVALVTATVAGGAPPFRFAWRLTEDADWVELAANGNLARLTFVLPSSCTIEVVATDARGSTASANLTVEPVPTEGEP